MASTGEQPSGYGKRPLWQWIVLYLVLAIVVYGLIYYFVFAKKAPYATQTYAPSPTVQQTVTQTLSPTPSVSPTQQPVISLTTNGFSPANITVKVGTTITWANKSGETATVNSDPHPTHTNYPPLNLGQFSNGQSLSLTFPKTGTYGYHNHYNPSQHGTIIVIQ